MVLYLPRLYGHQTAQVKSGIEKSEAGSIPAFSWRIVCTDTQPEVCRSDHEANLGKNTYRIRQDTPENTEAVQDLHLSTTPQASLRSYLRYLFFEPTLLNLYINKIAVQQV